MEWDGSIAEQWHLFRFHHIEQYHTQQPASITSGIELCSIHTCIEAQADSTPIGLCTNALLICRAEKGW